MNNGGNIFNLVKMIQSSGNPAQFVQNLVASNPQAQGILQQVQNSTQGADPRNIALQLAKQRGISENDVMSMFNMLNGGKQ